MKHPIQYRQGDVIITRIESIPETAKRQRRKGPVILAAGEVTGHHHAIKSGKVRHFVDPSTHASYVEVAEALALLTHEEHAPISLPPGKYEVLIQREYHPKEIRRVAD